MAHYSSVALRGVLAGMFVSIAATFYLAMDSSFVSTMLFGYALLVILANGYNLFTGKIGFVLQQKPSYLIDLVLIVIGNFIGTWILAFAVKNANLYHVMSNGTALASVKLSKDLMPTLMLAILCGMLMYAAVSGYRKSSNSVEQIFIVLVSVSIFLVVGLEHSIANMYFFNIANAWSAAGMSRFFIALLGNGLGSIGIFLLERYAGLHESN